jgi:hypothetical protein
MLGRKLCGKVPHVTGTSILRKAAGQTLELYIDVDSDVFTDIQVVIEAILQETEGRGEFYGYELHVRLVGTPKFAGSPS